MLALSLLPFVLLPFCLSFFPTPAPLRPPSSIHSTPSPPSRVNLVQNNMNAKKNELLNKLAAVDTSDKWNSIEQSVSTLVRSNPVSTTTDSNLLDGTCKYIGQHTTTYAPFVHVHTLLFTRLCAGQLACQSTNATAVLTLPPPRRSSLSSSANSPTTSAPLITTTATTISLSQSAPSLSKKTGLLLNALAVTQTHTPTALTRTSITTSRRRSLVLCNALTIPLPGKATTLITIHYLDSTLCILQENNVLEGEASRSGG